MSKINLEADAYNNCFKGQHDFIEIYSVVSNYDGDKIVRRCKKCGCIVVDVEVDGRLMEHEMKLKSSLMAREVLAKIGE